ncbi:hypothetical protein BBP40_003383 [Aspergillus hancockii]|nr:hypothetical protein BBP40_003383 [Aspergillus hancockii]
MSFIDRDTCHWAFNLAVTLWSVDWTRYFLTRRRRKLAFQNIFALALHTDIINKTHYARLHPANGLLDPKLYTVEYVRPRSSLLFSWILALTAQLDHGSAAK